MAFHPLSTIVLAIWLGLTCALAVRLYQVKQENLCLRRAGITLTQALPESECRE